MGPPSFSLCPTLTTSLICTLFTCAHHTLHTCTHHTLHTCTHHTLHTCTHHTLHTRIHHTHLTQLDLRPAGKIILQVKLYGKPTGMKHSLCLTNSNLTLITEVHNLIHTLINYIRDQFNYSHFPSCLHPINVCTIPCFVAFLQPKNYKLCQPCPQVY